ncbi:hypothetical protein NDU88_013027 [Pleurodeles waltl]|uniref:Uncharacterized protein n=1 Tax=Pleurodeles waltl TaxID=8319 RepID=A0AAV7R4G0_PLEWA|nr:hypothetical protein NDU88_013027 [Pleurodeles waltl]
MTSGETPASLREKRKEEEGTKQKERPRETESGAKRDDYGQGSEQDAIPKTINKRGIEGDSREKYRFRIATRETNLTEREGDERRHQPRFRRSVAPTGTESHRQLNRTFKWEGEEGAGNV